MTDPIPELARQLIIAHEAERKASDAFNVLSRQTAKAMEVAGTNVVTVDGVKIVAWGGNAYPERSGA